MFEALVVGLLSAILCTLLEQNRQREKRRQIELRKAEEAMKRGREWWQV